MNDSLATMEQIRILENNLLALHQAAQTGKAFIHEFQKAISLQWWLGFISLTGAFIIGILAYRFAIKAIKAFRPEYKLPRRWLYAFITWCVVSTVFFFLLPKMVTIEVSNEREISNSSNN